MSVNAAVTAPTRVTTLHYAVLVALAVLLLYGPTFLSMAATWSRDATFAHGFAIPLISLWLFWQRRAQLMSVPVAPARAGLWCCLALMVVWFIGDLSKVEVVAQAAATALIPAALWAALGTEFVRHASFPLAYLAFAVPFGDVFVPALMRFTTEFTVAAVRLVGVPIFREGNLFSLPSGNFEVVKACSGVRYLIASLALGVLYAGISYNDWRRRLAFVGLSIVVPIIANGLRAFGIVMIAHGSQMEYAVGVDHLIYGWLFFGLVMALLFWIGNRFAEPVVAATPSMTPPPRLRLGREIWLTGAALGALLLLGPAASVWLRTTASVEQLDRLSKRLPAATDEWVGPTDLRDAWRAAFAQHSDGISSRYEGKQGSILLFERDYPSDAEPETALTGAALVDQETGTWRVEQRGVVEVAPGVRVQSAQISGTDGTRLEVWIWYLIDWQPTASPIRAKWLQLRSWLGLRHPNASIVAIAAPGQRGSDAHGQLAAFVARYPVLLGQRAAVP